MVAIQAPLHELYGGRIYVGKKPTTFRMAISSLYISVRLSSSVKMERLAWDQVCEANWCPLECIFWITAFQDGVVSMAPFPLLMPVMKKVARALWESRRLIIPSV
jgi:hypothetical protein